MGQFRPTFGNFDDNQTRRKQTSDTSLKLAIWGIRKYNLFRDIFRFHNSKETVMNFTKYINVAHTLTKFKYFAKQIIFWNSPARKL